MTRQEKVAAVKRLFETHHTAIYNVCVRMLGHPEEAEDVTQDVFVKAFKAYDTFRGASDPGTWLYRIAVNMCLNHQRRQKALRWLSLDFFTDNPASFPVQNHSERPDEKLERVQMERMVQEAIRSLPARQRAALVLSRYEGLSYQEIAATLGCSVASVESLLHRAKQNLAKKLRPVMEG